MKERLALYPGEFSPISNSELSFISSFIEKERVSAVLLPLVFGSSASLSERIEMIEAAKKESGIPFKVDTSLLNERLEEALKKYEGKELFVMLDKENERSLSFSSFFDCLKDYKTVRNEDIGVSFLSSERDNRLLSCIELKEGVLRLIHEKKLYYIEKVSEFLKEKRLPHSESVALLSYEIALSNRLPNPGRAYIAGLLHDIGKYVNEEDALEIFAENHIKETENCPEWAYHQFVGAFFAAKYFHIKDEEILSAIRYHCSGNSDMNPLGEILYSADKIDPLRGWDSLSYIERCKEDYHKGFIDVLRANREFLKEKAGEEAESCLLAKKCYEAYL